MTDYTLNDVHRKLGSLEAMLIENRRQLSGLETLIRNTFTAVDTPGPERVDGGLFVPGTGVIADGERVLSPTAQAAEAALDQRDESEHT